MAFLSFLGFILVVDAVVDIFFLQRGTRQSWITLSIGMLCLLFPVIYWLATWCIMCQL